MLLEIVMSSLYMVNINIFVTIWVVYIQEPSLGAVTSLYLLCCILRIVKIKDLANIVAAALLCYPEIFPESSEAKLNGDLLSHASLEVPSQNKDANNQNAESDILHSALNHNYGSMRFAPRYSIVLLTYSFVYSFFIFSLRHPCIWLPTSSFIGNIIFDID